VCFQEGVDLRSQWARVCRVGSLNHVSFHVRPCFVPNSQQNAFCSHDDIMICKEDAFCFSCPIASRMPSVCSHDDIMTCKEGWYSLHKIFLHVLASWCAHTKKGTTHQYPSDRLTAFKCSHRLHASYTMDKTD